MHIAADVISVADGFRAEDVVQVIVDSANKSTWPVITKEYSRVICTWCVDSASCGSCAKPQ